MWILGLKGIIHYISKVNVVDIMKQSTFYTGITMQEEFLKKW